MFDIGWSELLVIAVVAIVVIGPKDLPRALRTVGQWTGRMKRMAREFQGQFNEALREAELDSVRRDVEALGKIDPVADIRKEMTKTGDVIKQSLDAPAPAPVKAADPPALAVVSAETPAAEEAKP